MTRPQGVSAGKPYAPRTRENVPPGYTTIPAPAFARVAGSCDVDTKGG